SGTTNNLVKIVSQIKNEENSGAVLEVEQMHMKYLKVIDELFHERNYFERAETFLKNIFGQLLSLSKEKYSIKNEKIILAQGELISTNLFQLFLEQEKIESTLISALSFMKTDSYDEPDKDYIEQNIRKVLSENSGTSNFITQGYICKNPKGEIDNLQRGGSDYTASLIGEAIKAEQIQIYTDIDGMHNNDPRFVDQTFSIDEISFDEAAELAYFGAKILHPQSILPAKENNIPVLLKNTFNPEANGTLIKNCEKQGYGIRAIAAKDNITAIKIKSYRMLMAYGFLKKIFDVFDRNKTAIDMITTSEVAVSLTVDNTDYLDLIIEELSDYGNVVVDSDLSIICIAGNISQNNKGITASIFNSLKHIPIRMISYGGSDFNLSFLVETSHKITVLNLLNEGLFKDEMLPENEFIETV
ncbi:MAG: aspartate kinase, partial [Bacteroidota bacterium]